MADISSITLPGGGTYNLKDNNAQPKIAANGILKGDGQGGVSAAVAGTDYASASAVASLNERYTNNNIWLTNTDANDYKISGMYAMATGNTNVPAPWGILFVQGAIYDTIEQEYSYGGYIWHREYRSGSWRQWTLAANQSQLAYAEVGNASRNYTAGQFICWNGLTYTADRNISSGETFYTSGGNKNLTECVGGGFNYLKSRLAIVSGSANAGGGVSSVAYPSGFNKTNCTVLSCFVDIYDARWPVDSVGYAILYNDRIELHNAAGGASSTIGTIYALLFKL